MQELKDKYIDPFTDFGFKKLFGEESNKELLLNFLNAVLHKKEGKIVSLSYLKTERPGVSENSRKDIFDMYCENEKGEKFIVELQKTKQAFSKDYTLYYNTFPRMDQVIPGGRDFKVKTIYAITVLNFIFEDSKNDTEKYRYDVMLCDTKTNKIHYNKLVLIYLEVPKFAKEADALETNFEKWMYVLKNLKCLDNIPDKLREHNFERIFASAEIAKLTPDEYRDYVDSLNSYRDLKNSLDYAKKEGEAKGRAEGKLEERLEIAKNAKALGLSVEQIQKLTNLTHKEIETI